MNEQTNGFLASIITAAADDPERPDHAEAVSYAAKFRSLEDTFFNHVHPFVDMGLAMREVEVAGVGAPNIFTTHGSRHIADLIRSLDKLAEAIAAEEPRSRLGALEAYILLCAAHVHDAANVKKREDHPQRCSEVIQDYKALFANSAAIQQVYDVASVHGGVHPTFGKDTFRSLDFNNSQQPRLPLLAALLRFGDELSENPERVPELVAKHHQHSAESQLAFAYARSFRRFDLRADHLYLTYGVYPDDAALQVTINGKAVTFFDFLEAKLDGIDREARYCSQYGRPHFHIAQVKVTVQVFERPVPSPMKAALNFTWPLFNGYPTTSEPICRRSPELKDRGVKSLAECFDQPESPVI